MVLAPDATATKTLLFHKKDFLLSLTLVSVAFLGAVHALIRSFNQGPNLDRELDSLSYISVADSLVNGDGITTFSGHSPALWPPLYPITIALIGLLKIDSVYAGLFVNAVAFGLVIMWTGIWIYQYVGSQLLALGAAVTVMTSYTLTWLSSNLLSEPLFICLAFLALAQLGRFIDSEYYQQSTILWSAFFTALASITMYMGVTIIFTAVILIMIHTKLSFSRKLKYAAVYFSISVAPLMLWMFRNWLIFGSFAGNRGLIISQRSGYFADIWSRLGDVFHLWIFSEATPGWLGVLLVLVAIFMATSMIHVGVIRWFKNLGPSLPFALYCLVYFLIFVIILPLYDWYDVHGDRYISPIYVPVIIVLIVLLYQSYRSLIWDKRRITKWICLLLIWVGLGEVILRAARLNFSETGDRIEQQILSVDGYSRNSETIDYFIRNPIDGKIYSNKAVALFGMAVIYDVAEVKRVYSIPEGAELRDCLSWIQKIGKSDERPYLVYFLEGIASESCNPIELESQSNDLELVTRTSDGVVYKVTTPS